MIPRARRDLPQKRGQQPPAAAALFTLTLVAATVLRLVSPPEAETIEQALARAYTNNPQVNAQCAIVRQADEGVPQALSDRPNVSANASVGREYTDIKQVIPPTPPFLTTKGLGTPRSVGATVNQTLFNGQQTANRVRAAESQVTMARETLRVMEQSVLLLRRPPRWSVWRLRRSRPRSPPARRRIPPSSQLYTASMSRNFKSRSPRARCFPRSLPNTTCNTAYFRSFCPPSVHRHGHAQPVGADLSGRRGIFRDPSQQRVA
jgi:Outer membrane efflux protein